MNSYEYVSMIAVFCYVFLILVFLASKKNRIIRGFLAVLFSMLIWTLGSVFMRAQAAPSYVFWFHLSIGGLLLMPYTFFMFIKAFTNHEDKSGNIVYFLMLAIIFIINVQTGVFIHYPQIVEIGSKILFEYNMTYIVSIMFIAVCVILIHCFKILKDYYKINPSARHNINPILQGVFALVLGHILVMLPIFKTFPIDILSGVVNAAFMLKAVVKKHLFELKLLGSRTVYYGLGLILTSILFYNISPFILRICDLFFLEDTIHYYICFSIFFILAFFVVSQLWNIVINHVFIKEETDYAEKIKEFSNRISNTLMVDEILNYFVEMIQTINGHTNIYICLKKEDNYEACFSNQALFDLSFTIKKDNPIVSILLQESFISMKDLTLMVEYRSIWESEKEQLKRLNITHFVALKNDQELIGMVLLSGENKNKIQYKDLLMISSVASIVSMAIQNAQLYERVYTEARTDELTGLLNRKYFAEVLEQIFNENKEETLAFAILNLDDFKLYNQLYGMNQGDIALKNIAQIISTTVSDQGVVARYSGKEFAIVLPKYDVFTAKNLVQSICDQIAAMNKKEKGEYKVKTITVSAGISSYPFGSTTVSELVSHADMAVYHVKHKGKNGIQIFDTVLQHTIEEKEEKNSKDIYQEYEATIFALMAAIDAKDHYTFSHSHNVAYYATSLAKMMGYDKDVIEIIRQAALLHDIGKISIPESILNKNGILTPDEYEQMKNHVEASIEIIRHLPSLDYVIPAVLGHHERYDGKGYPRRIQGEDIPLFARILCIADSFDAMTSKRCYKEKMTVDKSLSILKSEAGHQFDPKLVSLFVKGFETGQIQMADQLIREK